MLSLSNHSLRIPDALNRHIFTNLLGYSIYLKGKFKVNSITSHAIN